MLSSWKDPPTLITLIFLGTPISSLLIRHSTSDSAILTTGGVVYPNPEFTTSIPVILPWSIIAFNFAFPSTKTIGLTYPLPPVFTDTPTILPFSTIAVAVDLFVGIIPITEGTFL